MFFGSVALIAIGVSLAANAADMAVKAPPIPELPYNWSGTYVGANVGGAWTSGNLNIPSNNFYGGLTEFIAGIQAGYNFQAGHFLFGVEGDFDGATFGHPALPTPTLGSVSQNWIGTIAGRAGIVEDRWLVFAKAGGGWVHSNAVLNFPGVSWTGSTTSSAWLAGAGVEYGFKSHWTIKLEYDYLALSNWTSPTLPPIRLNRDLQMVKFGANYKFDSGLPDTVAPTRTGHSGEPSEDESLAQKSQNPIADMVSVPFQSNTNFNAGPFNRTQEVLNIQPVVPLRVNADWNVISRTIMPVISQPNPIFDSNTNGIGDITQEFFLTPTHPGALIWGVGPVFTVPSATDPILGTGRVLAGPTAVFLTTPGHWVIGVLLNNQWSVGGNPLRPNVNEFLAQPFINYNMAHGWYLTSSPVITADWLAAPDQRWIVPIGGGFGRIFKIGDQPVSANIAGYYNVVRPTNSPSWQLRAQLSLLFPER
ncbi:outer membrane protein [Bradyrhizobium sp. UFLA05-153]